MRRRLLAGLITLLLAVLVASPAAAVTDGVPDNGAHPYVGLVVFYVCDESGALVPSHRCSGTLL